MCYRLNIDWHIFCIALYLVNQQDINSLVISPFMAPLSIPIPEREEQLFSLTLLVHMDSKDMP